MMAQDPHLKINAVRFAGVAAGTRFVLRDIESRWQIVAFCVAVVALEFLTRRKRPHSYVRALILSGVCTASILTVKLVTEPEVVPLAIWTAKADVKHLGQHIEGH